jgi:hypothetical protein
MWSIPEVRDGLVATPTIFRDSFGEFLRATCVHRIALRDDSEYFFHAGTSVGYQVRGAMGDTFTTTVRADGIILTTWEGPRLNDTLAINALAREALPMHSRLFEELTYRGTVTVGFEFVGPIPAHPGSVGTTSFSLPAVGVSEIPGLLSRVEREVNRSLGMLAYEPEP